MILGKADGQGARDRNAPTIVAGETRIVLSSAGRFRTDEIDIALSLGAAPEVIPT
jgi:hypothetical protein